MQHKTNDYQTIVKKYIAKLETRLALNQDPYLLQLFQNTKTLIVKNPNLSDKQLDFYIN